MKYFWVMQDFSYTQDAPTSDTWGNLRSDPITSQVFRGKPRTSSLASHDESSNGLPFQLDQVLFVGFIPCALANMTVQYFLNLLCI